MSFKIAAASSDGVNVNLHFGQADKFYIYEAETSGEYNLIKINSPPVHEKGQDSGLVKVSGCGSVGGCGAGGCHGGAVSGIDTSFLDGSKYVLAVKIGKGIEKSLLKNGITAFSVEIPIEQAVRKIVIYEKRLNKFK